MYELTLIKEIFATVIHPEGGFTDPRESRHVVFVCGSLMDPDFLKDVVGRAPAVCPAVAPEYGRGWGEADGKKMHFMRPESGGVLPGMAILGLDDAELARLEAFEQCPALRRRADLTIRIGDISVPAHTYLQKE